MAEEKKGLDLKASRERRKSPPTGDSAKQSAKVTSAKATSRVAVEEPDDDDEDDDDGLLDDVDEEGGVKKGPAMIVIVAGVAVVVIVILAFLLFGGKKNPSGDVPPPETGEVVPTPAVTATVAPDAEPGPEAPPVSGGKPDGVGTQDFTGNTNMSNSDVLTAPDKYIQDLYGLTTRVDYTVSKISYVADFVSYTKHRGTWGGGLELYWLDAEYKNRKYVVQVPFQYYKELTDVGIVPVKMEVLTIHGSAEDEVLTVISYMTLDEKTLKDILKSQAKAG